MAEWLGLWSNSARDGIYLMTTVLHCTELSIIAPSLSQFDLDNVERDRKHQIVIILWVFHVLTLFIYVLSSFAY